jgi:hypothetical protein
MSGIIEQGKEFLSNNSGNNNNTTSTQGNQGTEDYADKGAFLSCSWPVYNGC